MIASLEATAMVHLAASRAAVNLNRISGALSLLSSSMGETKHPIEPDVINFWHGVLLWLRDAVDDDADNLDQSLRHDELTAAHKRKGSSS